VAKTKRKRFTDLEMRIMQGFWDLGPSPIRDIQETWAERERPAYTTVQTIVYRLEQKGALRRKRKIGNAHIFEALVTRDEAVGRLVDSIYQSNPEITVTLYRGNRVLHVQEQTLASN
jgi:predicted transcriptional regulator